MATVGTSAAEATSSWLHQRRQPPPPGPRAGWLVAAVVAVARPRGPRVWVGSAPDIDGNGVRSCRRRVRQGLLTNSVGIRCTSLIGDWKQSAPRLSVWRPLRLAAPHASSSPCCCDPAGVIGEPTNRLAGLHYEHAQ